MGKVRAAIIQARNDLKNAAKLKTASLSETQGNILSRIETLIDEIKKAIQARILLSPLQDPAPLQKNLQQSSISKETSLSQARNLCISITQNSLNGDEKSESVVRIIENKIPSKSKVYIEMIQTPFFILFAHELIHMKHFLEEKCSKQINLNLIEDIKDLSKLEQLPTVAYSTAGKDAFGGMQLAQMRQRNFPLPEFDTMSDKKTIELIQNLEERRTVLETNKGDITENSIRREHSFPLRYIYQGEKICEDGSVFEKVIPGGVEYMKSICTQAE
ncbi:MAG: hypothetical protein IJ599_05230 [Alphaproteobacteria bacterium]|nr:hypothetical protein [Alphaproteobacteria bacterium]